MNLLLLFLLTIPNAPTLPSNHGTLLQSPNTANVMQAPDCTPVSEFDLDRYLGTWYEIARYPHPFEKNLVGVTATYSIKKNGKIKVVNSGYRKTLDGRFQRAVGKAKWGSSDGSGHLKVSFFLFFYGDYFVMELDPDYQWALVGTGSSDYLWILARTPQIDDQLLKELKSKARQRGYDLTALEMVPQKVKNVGL